MEPRENEVVPASAQGHSNAEIAGELFMTTVTDDDLEARFRETLPDTGRAAGEGGLSR